MTSKSEQNKGLLATAGAFGWWGFVVIYWKNLTGYDSFELIFYRLVFSFIFLLAIIRIRGKWGVFVKSIKNPKVLRLHFFNGFLITGNWLAYVYAVTHERILEGSLAYFMVPILNMAMGFLILKEKLNRLQLIAIALATAGVINEIIQFGAVPWLALVMAVSFAIYGMNKKRSNLGPVTALAMETGLFFPLAVGGLVFMHFTGSTTFEITQPSELLLAISTGTITIIPLLLFAYGASRVQLTTIGLFQFIAPSLKFGIGVYLYGEAFPPSKMITFALIWIALFLYIFHLFSSRKSPNS